MVQYVDSSQIIKSMEFVEISDFCSDVTLGDIDGYVACTNTLEGCKGDPNCEQLARNYTSAVKSGGFSGSFEGYKTTYGGVAQPQVQDGQSMPFKTNRTPLIIALVVGAVVITGVIWYLTKKNKNN